MCIERRAINNHVMNDQTMNRPREESMGAVPLRGVAPAVAAAEEGDAPGVPPVDMLVELFNAAGHMVTQQRLQCALEATPKSNRCPVRPC